MNTEDLGKSKVLNLIFKPFGLLMGSKVREWNHIFVLVYGIFVILLGNLTPRIPFKSFMGIWLPWLFKSEDIWRRAHRLAGFIYMGFGIV